MERERFPLLAGAALLAGVAFLRAGLEKVLFTADGTGPFSGLASIRGLGDPSSPLPGTGFLSMDSLGAWGGQIAFLVLLFLGVVGITSRASGLPARRIVNAALLAWPLLLLAPFLDRFVFAAVPGLHTCPDPGGTLRATVALSCYEVVNFAHVASDPLSGILWPGTPWGLRLEALTLVGLPSVYVAVRSRSGPRTLAALVGTFLLLGLLGALYAPGSPGDVPSGPAAAVGQLLHLERFLVFFSMAIAAGALLLLSESRRAFVFLLGTPGLWVAGIVAVGPLLGVLFSPAKPLAVLALVLLTAAASWSASALIADAWGGPRFRPTGREMMALAIGPAFLIGLELGVLAFVFAVLVFAVVFYSLLPALGTPGERRGPPESAPFPPVARRRIALLAIVVATGLAAAQGPVALLSVGILAGVAWLTAAVFRARRAFAENVPAFHLVLHAGAAYFASPTGLVIGAAPLVLGAGVVMAPAVPFASPEVNAWAASAGLLLVALMLVGGLLHGRIGRRVAGPSPPDAGAPPTP